MEIDFPEAQEDNPTQCLALAISQPQIKRVTDELNEQFPLIDDKNGWSFSESNFFLTNDIVINHLISHLIYIFTENNKAKDVFADLVLKELIIRLMQTKARTILLENFQQNINTNRLAYAVKYIHENLHRTLSVKELSEKACMSEPNFYRCFKQQFGISPVEYVNQKRIDLAKKTSPMYRNKYC
ncbi:AraC family transcriptional regulator [Emticicia oligotrophica]|uniref:AraC family transcriptional regulator n=1 Tax=Emticicia oligotrophica TaxID=312279 RepID=UPI000302795C|nr:AraC family transcriptional regulator [Emticicia oligotrophica]